MVIAFAPSSLNPALLQTPTWDGSRQNVRRPEIDYCTMQYLHSGMVYSASSYRQSKWTQSGHKARPRLRDTISYGSFRMQHQYARPRLHHPSILIRPFMVLRILTCRLEGEMSI